MSVLLLPFADLPADLGEASVIFGGTFDPCHAGHASVVRRLGERFLRVIVAPTERNPWKTEKPTPLALRTAMIELVLKSESITLGHHLTERGVVLSSLSYRYAEELVLALRPSLGTNLWWAVAEDSASGVERWRNWGALAVPTVVLPITVDMHSEAVRQGTESPHPALRSFIKENRLYLNQKNTLPERTVR